MKSARKKRIKTAAKRHLHLVKNKYSPRAPARIDPPMPEETLESADKQELNQLGDQLNPSDPKFQSELNYEGYHSIEEYDNDSYGSLAPERNEDTPREVSIEDRKPIADSGEENLLDPQENRK
jgi:hypothetical protein